MPYRPQGINRQVLPGLYEQSWYCTGVNAEGVDLLLFPRKNMFDILILCGIIIDENLQTLQWNYMYTQAPRFTWCIGVRANSGHSVDVS